MPRISFAQTLLPSQVVALASTMALIAAAVLSCTASQDAATTTTPADAQAPSVIPVATDAAPADEAPTAPEDLKVFRMPTTPYLIPDPHHAFDAGSTQLIAELYSGLMRYRDYDDRIEVEGDLAESHSVSDDGLTYTFRLRNDMRYSDGSPVTAADFKWTWERALTEGTWERIFENLSPIQGAEALAAGDAETLTGVEVIDDRTLRVRLASPRYDFLMRMADPTAVVLRPANVVEWGTNFSVVRGSWEYPGPFQFAKHPVGTGPFQLDEFDYESSITQIFPNEHHVHGKPGVDLVELVTDKGAIGLSSQFDFFFVMGIGEQMTDLWSSLSSEEFHVLETLDDPRPSLPDGSGDDWVTWTAEDGFVSSFLVFNPTVAPFDDLELRSALVRAFDPAPFASPIGHHRPFGLAPMNFVELRSSVANELFDADHAVKLLSRSSRRDVSSILFHFPRSELGEPVEFWHVFDLWQHVLGIAVDQVETSAWNYAELQKQGALGVLPVQTKLSRPDPAQIYAALAETYEPIAARSEELARLRSLIGEAESEPDPAVRRTLFEQIETELSANALVLPVQWQRVGRFITTRRNILGLKTPRFYGSRLADLRIGE